MAEIVKIYRQEVGALRFIGQKYGDADRTNGGFGQQWEAFHKNAWFDVLEKLTADPKRTCEDGDAYIGLMRWKKGEPFQYWIGMFMPPDTPAPEGFASVDFPASSLGVCWVYGPESDVFMQEDKCSKKLAETYKIVTDREGAWWFFERYACPRFTTPDEKGNIILDICHYIE